jgi:3-hydroxyisobutyrate dehydrogenase-like beta-hydroxyacid dehydrogenase
MRDALWRHHVKPAVGFIGLGLMGRPMVANLLKKEFAVTVWNRTPARAAELVAQGARMAATPREAAAAADVLITIVSDPPAIEEVVWGKDGALEGLRRGSVFVDSSTISPGLARKEAAACAERGVEFLDAPVTGGTWGAEKGELVMMVGGPAETLNRVEPVFAAIAKRWFHLGPHGAGQTVKLAMNLLLALEVDAMAEALALTTAGGIAGERLVEVMQSSMARAPVLDMKAPMLLERKYAPSFPLRLMYKDVRLALDLAKELHVQLPAAEAIRGVYGSVLEAAREDLDYAAIGRFWEKPKT